MLLSRRARGGAKTLTECSGGRTHLGALCICADAIHTGRLRGCRQAGVHSGTAGATENAKWWGCSGSASFSSLRCPSSHPSRAAAGAVWLSTRCPSGRLAGGSGGGGSFLRSSSSLFLFLSFSCSSSCQEILRSEHRRSGHWGKLKCLSSGLTKQEGWR